MRSYAWPLLAALALITNACGGDGQTTSDGGRDGGDAGGRGGASGHGGGAAAAGTGGSLGGGGGSGGTTAGAGGSGGGGSGGTTGGSGGTTGGSGGATAGSGGATAGTGGATGGAGGKGGTTGGSGGATAGTGGATAGSGGSGGATAGSGGATAGIGGATAGTGGATAGAGGATAGSGGATAGTGGATAGTGGATAGSGGATAGSGGATAGSGGATAGTGGAGGTAGAGGTVPCTDASACPGGPDTDCQQKTCASNFCGLHFTAANTPVTSQTPGDCKQDVCDGVGGVTPSILDSDAPADDGNACTAETCVNGLPSHPAEPAHTACAQDGGAWCNGSASAPACVVCVAATDCPGTDSICHKRICGNQSTCGFSNAPAGTAAEPDATGNCRKAVCDDTGGVTSAPDDSDVPADDGNSCTSDVCTGGAPSHPTKSDGTACAQNGGTFCHSAACVQCLTVSDCPGSDTACRTRTCDATFVCGHMDKPQGTAAGTDADGNCHKPVCDGNGTVVSAVDDTDLPVDGDGCTKDVCTNGAPSNPTLPPGAICSTDSAPPDGSKACDASAVCNPLTFRVVRVGPGLVSVATAVAIEERQLDGTLVGTIPLPTNSGGGSNQRLTMSGSANSEGCLTLSGDGHYLALAGYGATLGTAGVKGTLGNRVVGLIDIAGTVNTTTVFNTGDSGDNVRSAVTLDGVDLWVSGAAMVNANGGIWYNQRGATSGEMHVVATPNNTRCLGIFGNQLYGSSNTGAFTNVFSIGFATPTTTSAATSLKGMPTSGANPFGFVMFDLHNAPSGVDTMYVADDGMGTAGGGGIQKWTTSDGTNWAPGPVLNIAGNTGFRGVAGYAVGTNVTLMASTAEDSPNHLVVFVNDGPGSVVAPAPANTTFRGVALSPHFAAP
ncbi:MAG TPA: hypothetical protein VIF57_15985 [Polyangia bacterium]